MLYAAHQQHGKLPWAALAQPAIQLAVGALPCRPAVYLAGAGNPPASRRQRPPLFFSEDGRPRPVGNLLRNPDYADTLRRIDPPGPGRILSGAGGRRHGAQCKTTPRLVI